jgi:hypoxanthine-guanine phosphoribosyltransferase
LQINQFLLGNFKLEKEERLSSLLNSLSSSSILVVQDICSFGKSLGEIFANIEKVVESGHQIISLKEKLDLSLSNGN